MPALPPQVVGPPNPVPDWLPETCWQSVLALKEIADYHTLPEDLVSSAKRWREWLEMERPEDEPLPGGRLARGTGGRVKGIEMPRAMCGTAI